VEEEKERYIELKLKIRVGQPSDAAKYKTYDRKFEEGSTQEGIDMLIDLEESRTQNSLSECTDRFSALIKRSKFS
jgi:hypothetical protein